MPPVIHQAPHSKLQQPPAKKQKVVGSSYPTCTQLPADLGKCVERDVSVLREMGWEGFVKSKRGRGDIGGMKFDHPAKRLLQQYKLNGAPVKLHTKEWSKERVNRAMVRGPHKSCYEHLQFLQEEFVEMIDKKQWVILPYDEALLLPGLRISPPGCVPQRDRRPRWICDYTFYEVNQETINLFAEESMQFGHALERFLRELLLADPALGPVNIIKVDISDGFYRICLNIHDIPKLGVVFPTLPGQPRLVAFPLVLPMGWKNSPPIFSTATETIADLANRHINDPLHSPNQHPLSTLSSTFEAPITATPSSSTKPTIALNTVPKKMPTSAPAKVPIIAPTQVPTNVLTHVSNDHVKPTTLVPTIVPTNVPSDIPNTPSNNPNLHVPTNVPTGVPSDVPTTAPSDNPTSTNRSIPNTAVEIPTTRDPSLPSKPTRGYVDVFVDDFLVMCQGFDSQQRVRNILMNAIDEVFRPNDTSDESSRSEPISVKKLKKGDCSWSTCKVVLGWLVDTVAMTITLPDHRVQRLAEILTQIPKTQKRVGVKKWYKMLGELRSMALALPGARHLFSHMQLALVQKFGTRVSLKKGVHSAIDDFKLLLKDLQVRPTRIAELVPLNASAVGHHDASGTGAGGVWFPAKHLARRDKHKHGTPIVWRHQWPSYIRDELVTEENPHGKITNSDLELAGGILHLQALVQMCDVRERTVLSKTDNLAALFWQRKGSATTEKCPAHLLRLFGFHQRYHRYVPRHDYLSGPSNPLADASSRLFNLTNQRFLLHMNSLHKQQQPFQLLQLDNRVISSVTLALLRKPSKLESLLVAPKQQGQPGPCGNFTASSWPSTPYSKPSKANYRSYRSLHNVFEQERLHQTEIPSALERLRITYGTLGKRSSTWGPKILETTHPNKLTLD